MAVVPVRSNDTIDNMVALFSELILSCIILSEIANKISGKKQAIIVIIKNTIEFFVLTSIKKKTLCINNPYINICFLFSFFNIIPTKKYDAELIKYDAEKKRPINETLTFIRCKNN